jgi:Cdc6-like AAA superfamily ATPase
MAFFLPPRSSQRVFDTICHNRGVKEGKMNVERITAITIKVHDMPTSVHFYSKTGKPGVGKTTLVERVLERLGGSTTGSGDSIRRLACPAVESVNLL